PALDGLLDNRAFHLTRPRACEACGGAFWPPPLRRGCKAYPHRHRDALSDGDRLAVTQRRQEIHQPMRGLGEGAANNVLILLTGHPEGKYRIAFREQTGG